MGSVAVTLYRNHCAARGASMTLTFCPLTHSECVI